MLTTRHERGETLYRGVNLTAMVAARPLIVVAGAEPPVTDDVADRLRESCVVRTAYSTDEVLDRLDADVDVVLVASGLGPDAVGRIQRAVEERELPCRVGRLTDECDDGSGATDAVVDPSWADRRLRAELARLATLAQYRTALDEYFTLARRSAGDDTDEVPQDRLAYVRERLDDAAADLDSSSLFEAALRDTGRREGDDAGPADRSEDPDELPDGGVTVDDDSVPVESDDAAVVDDCEAGSSDPTE
jgi:hypothetical protein